MNVSSRQEHAPRICSPSPGVKSMKLRPRVDGPTVAPSVSQVCGSPLLDQYTRLGVVAAPPGPAVGLAPNAVATRRLLAFEADVWPGACAVTHTAPARGMATPAVPLTVAMTEPSAHEAPSQRRMVSTPFATYRYS